jgi:uncharacterized repeat protein (TIGR01451 family)
MNIAHRHDRFGRFHGLRIGLIASIITMAIGASTLGSASQSAFAINTTINGTVFEDFNNNGVQDTTTAISNSGAGTVGVAVDRGVAGVTVTAFDVNGNNVGSTTSGSTGAYSLFIATPDGPFRLEYSTLPAGYQPAFAGAGNGTSVQFAPDGVTSVRNFGIVNPVNYCQNNPELVTSCHRFGDQVNGANAGIPVIYGYPYSAGASATTNTPAPYDLPAPTAFLNANQAGTTLGIAYRRATRDLYFAAYFKKHAGFGPGANGILNDADDPGAIYRFNRTSGAITGIFTVPGAPTISHDISGAPDAFIRDNGNIAWDAVGKTSLGGMAISDDGTRLYVMNLENRTLYALNPDTGAVIASQAVPLAGHPTPGGTATTCAAGDVRPFAVEYYNGFVYVGIVCSAESTTNVNDLFGYVYQVNATSLAFNAAPIFQVALNYPRGFIEADKAADWRPWVPVFTTLPVDPDSFIGYPQPMLTGIQFDNGNLILGFRDRFGDQTGNEAQSNPANDELYTGVSAGDMLRACGAFGAWTLESNARCAGLGTGPQGNGQGPGGGSYYWGDGWYPPPPFFHDEVSVGTIVQVPGFPEVAMNSFNPIPGNAGEEAFDAGTRWLTNDTGALNKAYRIYNGAPADGRTFAKANGLGDLVALCDEAPIQLGNRVWNDANGNGRQDPNELPIANVTVELTNGAGVVVDTTTTAADGTYYFPSATGPAIQQNTAYQIRVSTTQAALAGLSLTTANSPASGSDTTNNAITDVRDSDATPAVTGSFAVIGYTTGGAGATNHGLDFGFTAGPPPPVFDLGDLPDTGPGTGPGNYETLLANGGPRHQIVPGLFMGATVDAESDGQPNAAANGDDINPVGAPDDEDGVVIADLTLQIGAAANIRVTATNTTGAGATLCGFVDFNGDGAFGVGETASVPVPTGSNNVQFTLPFSNVPAGSAAATYARFRLDTAGITCSPTGLGEIGEVEDYPVVITPQQARISLGDQVWYDTNNNGVLDAGEVGVPNVAMQLYYDTNADCIYSAGDTFLGTTTTGPTGFYTFTNLLQSAGPSTAYLVVITGTNFAPGGPLNSYQSSDGDIACNVQNQNERDHGVVVNGALGSGGFVSSRAMILTADNFTYDFGFYRLALGNLVWSDTNDNGTRDAGEAGIPNVPVRLIDCASQSLLDSTSTDANGIYTFTNMISGTYCVQIVVATGFSSTDIATTANPNNNVDNDDNGLGALAGVVTSNPINVTPGSPGALNNNIINNATGSTTNPTMDFGVRPPSQVTAGLGDFVWHDLNRNGIQDPGEPGVPGVTVTLYSQAGTPLGTQLTNASGLYLFTNLTPATYYVCFALPPGFVFTLPNQGGDDGRDSDADPATGCTPNVTLGPNEINLTIDAGIYRPTQTPRLEIRKAYATSTGTNQVTVGSRITYTLIVTSVGAAPATGVIITDAIPAGTEYVPGSAVPTQTSGPNPLVWNIGTMNPGQVQTVRFSVRVVPNSLTSIRNVAQVGDQTTTSDSNETQNTFTPDAVTLSSFTAAAQTGGVKVAWTTAMERDTWGFFVLRSTTGNRSDAVKVNAEIVVAKGTNGGGGSYSVVDPAGGVNNRYWLQEIETGDKKVNEYGPVTASAPAAVNPNPAPAPVSNPVQPQPQPQLSQPVAVNPAPAAAAPAAPAPAVQTQVQAPAPAPVTTGNGVPGASSAPATNAQAVTAPQTAPPVVAAAEAGNANASQQVAAPVAPAQAAAPAEAAQAEQPQLLSQSEAETQQIVASSSEVKTALEAVPAEQPEAAGVANAVNVVRGNRAVKAGELAIQPGAAEQPSNPALPLAVGLGLLALIGAGLGGAALFVARRRRSA